MTERNIEDKQPVRHAWGGLRDDGWRGCLHPGCRWQYKAGLKKPYRVQGSARRGNVGKALPCKGSP